ncbi:hypothetical protein [Streptomyces sp. WG7]|uniref:hypothetical protein n=1 Tax=Streptomyces sp. WG7 TaxID=3417650 RepID=UPI003CEC8F92
MDRDLSFFRSQTAQSLRAEGYAQGLAEAVLRVLERRGVVVSEEERARIVGCTDPDTLNVWLNRAIAVVSAAEVFTPGGE